MATFPDEHVGGPEQAFSYIRRRGRFTQAQARAYENLVEQYRVTPEHLIAHSGPIGLEIGLAWVQSCWHGRSKALTGICAVSSCISLALAPC
ncbi:MAG: hypothetical protein CM15mP120_07620 [Pseudomonadota bacterium]|nr:MAG: hypothetical protein CM15mP120_07620 [Pseudomonadota bacterium]